MDGPHVGVGKCVNFEREDRVLEVQCCRLRPGKRQLIVTGVAGQILRDCVFTAYHLISAHAVAVTEALALAPLGGGGNKGGPSELILPLRDIHVHIVSSEGATHPMYKGAIAVALLSLLAGRRPREDTVIVADLNCMGMLCPMGDTLTAAMLDRCSSQGVRRVVIADTQELPEGQEDLDHRQLCWLRHKMVWDAFVDML